MTYKGFEELIPRENPYLGEPGEIAPATNKFGTLREPFRRVQPIPIRTLGRRHRPAILRHLLALDGPDRYLRFGYAVSDVHIANYVNHLDFDRDEIYGVYNGKLALIAVAHLAFNADTTHQHPAEFGVSVAHTHRGRGYGGQLFGRALLHARNQGVTAMMIHALSENTTMINIATRAGAVVVREGAESEAYLQLPAATYASHVGEMIGEQFGELNYSVKRQAKTMHELIDQWTLPGSL
jgi:RimJ/RimL family protein N-acetyltransferase